MRDRFEPGIVIRASSIEPMADCLRRGAARAFRAIIENDFGYALRDTPQSITGPIGTAVHAAGAYALQQRMDGRAPTWPSTLEAGIASLATDIEERGEIVWDPSAPNRNLAEKQVRRLAHELFVGVVPQLHPIAVEDRMEVEYAPGVTISGTLDYFCVEHGLDGMHLHDLKTSAKASFFVRQTGTYSLIRRSHGQDVAKASIIWLPRTPLNKPQPAARFIPVDLELAERAALRMIEDIVAKLRAFQETGDPLVFHANPVSKLCSPRWCPAFGTAFCREHVIEADLESAA